MSFFQYSEQEGYGEPEIDFIATEKKYLDAKSAFVKAIRKNTTSIPPPLPPRGQANGDSSDDSSKQQAALLETFLRNPSVSKPSSEIELPKFKITPFGGDYREWPEFRDMFLGSVGCKEKLPGAQKMRYLKSFLTDEAAKLLNGIEIADCNYEQAWEKLERRYNKPLYIINAHIESFMKMPTVVVADSGHLRRLADKSDEVIRGLKALKSESRDPWLIYLMLSKTDLDTRKAWALHNDNSEKTTVQELIDFLEKRCDALEACTSKSNHSKNSGNKIPTRSGSSANNIKSLAVSNSVCPMCKQNHNLPQCSQFLALPITARRSYARYQKFCYNCYGSNHSSSRCRSKARCPHCRIRHHVLVHLDSLSSVSEANNSNGAIASTSQASSLPIVSKHIQKDIRPSGILPTVLVQIPDIFGNTHLCRVLLDTGSKASIVTEGLVKRLHLRRRHAHVPISGISSLEAGVTQGAVTLKLKSCFDSNEMDVEAFILSQITSKTPPLPLDLDRSLLLNDLRLADPGFNVPGPIDILLGSDKAWSILLGGRRRDNNGNFIAHNTIFGWVITGKCPKEEIVSLTVGIVQDVDVLLKSFWEIEELPQNTYSLDSGDFADAHFCKTFSRAPDNKYVVELPFRQKDVEFRNTLSGALSRLFAMERRFSRQENLRLEYCRFMKIYQELGHMESIPEGETEPTSGKIFYLPHHAVLTNKLRVVFDGSHKDENGTSLNEMLHIGPPLQRNLINVCLRFRVHRFVFCADIIKMFRQIWVDKKHRDFQRIVWRDSPDQPIGHYRLCTVTYGTSPAHFLSMRVLKQLAIDYADKFSVASHAILHDFYVDDIMTGSDSISGILELKAELLELLSCGGLQLSKWSSNCWPVLQGIDCDPTVSLAIRVSSWFRVIRIVAVFVRRARNGKLPPEERIKGFLRSKELLYAKRKCLLWAQEEFYEEIQSLKTKNCVSTRSKLASLSPFLDDVGLLRVGGRICNAVNVSFSLKHPIILPKGHPVSTRILQDPHIKFLHAGVSELFSLVRQEFWIFGCRNHIRKIVHGCMACFRQRQATTTQLMGNLPSSRLSPSFAFDRTGCDYAGPITLRIARGRNPKYTKGYLALFVCMATKALHLEVVSDLSTDAFLAALRRFIARRGKCSVIYSDNGTNFIGAARTLCEWVRLVRSKEHNNLVSSTLAAESIKWEFIPPHSPHFGGLWEADVKSVKQHLRRVIGNNILTFEEMSTLLSQIEALLNSRPLCAISDLDLNPLTPSHFLISRPYTAIPEPSCLDVSLNRLGRWQLIQNMLPGFWRRWSSEYLTSLQQRSKWKKKTRNFKKGDLVVIKELNLPPSRWALGRVEELHQGEDDLVRVVSVRTKNGIFKRPITKLAILPCS